VWERRALEKRLKNEKRRALEKLYAGRDEEHQQPRRIVILFSISLFNFAAVKGRRAPSAPGAKRLRAGESCCAPLGYAGVFSILFFNFFV